MKEKESVALKYLNEKYKDYHDEFEIVETNFAGYTGLKDVYYVRSKTLKNKRIVVECINEHFKDNYISLLFIKTYEERIQLIYTKKFGCCKCICSDHVYPTDRFTVVTTFDNYICDINNSIREVLLVEAQDADAVAAQAIDIMHDLNIPHKSLNVKVVKDIEVMKKISTYMELEKYEENNQNCYEADILLKMKGFEVIARIDRGII